MEIASREKKHAYLMNMVIRLQAEVMEMADLVDKVEGKGPCLVSTTDQPEMPVSLARALETAPSDIMAITKQLQELRERLETLLF